MEPTESQFNCDIFEFPHSHYDMQDLNDYSPLDPLKKAIMVFNNTIEGKYVFFDADAVEKQNKRNHYLYRTILAGTVALLFAIIQFSLAAINIEVQYQWSLILFALFELITAIFAAYAIYGGYLLFHTKWLLSRHKAERLRLLKFRYLIDSRLWCDDPIKINEWTASLEKEVSKIEIMTDSDIDQWLIDSKIPNPPQIDACFYHKENIAAFLNYYIDKRLNYQKKYYCKKIKDLTKDDKRFPEKLPLKLYLMGVILVFIHVIFVFVYLISETALVHFLGILSMAFAISLPLIGAAISSIRSGFEISRTIRLFKGKYSAIDRLGKKLEDQLKSQKFQWEEIAIILWECENFLEAEHHEWLLLIKNIELHY